jgi:hypothetical protein
MDGQCGEDSVNSCHDFKTVPATGWDVIFWRDMVGFQEIAYNFVGERHDSITIFHGEEEVDDVDNVDGVSPRAWRYNDEEWDIDWGTIKNSNLSVPGHKPFIRIA